MKRILLTGASGTVGREVLKQLCDLPGEHIITVFDKNSKSAESFLSKFTGSINIVFGDISNKSEVYQVCSGQDIVIHLAAIIPPLADENPDLAERVNILGTRNLIECFEKLSPNAFFIYSSSISVYGDRNGDPWIKTSDPLKPSDRDEYARTKIEAEQIIMKSRLPWTIFRLTAIMGINNHKPSALMFHMPLDSYLEIATPADTGRAFIKSIDHQDDLSGRIFNLSGGEKCRIIYKEFMSRSFDIFGLGTPDFKSGSFAEKNFHCGYYEDGDLLNDILDFRRDTIEDYFRMVKDSVNPLRRLVTRMISPVIRSRLQKKSEPLAAIRKNNNEDIEHYFRKV